jgi:Nucleotidyl transferase AbiEii toxin, Type IV TA system
MSWSLFGPRCPRGSQGRSAKRWRHMAEHFLALSREDRLEALGVSATESGRPVHLLEKDIWVVWTIGALFSSEFGEHLVFKGGTSLSKGYRIIGRFSEDIDVTYDVRELVPELVGDTGPIPKSKSQASRWREAIDEKLPAWVQDKALAAIEKHIEATGVDVKVTVEGTDIYIDYDPLAKGTGYVAPRVKVEFGARSTGEPCEERQITCDAAARLPALMFPTATPRVMLPKRTFWEKATAVHAYCRRGKQGDRYSRHWHDIVRLDEAGYAQAALDDRALANEVAEFKAILPGQGWQGQSHRLCGGRLRRSLTGSGCRSPQGARSRLQENGRGRRPFGRRGAFCRSYRVLHRPGAAGECQRRGSVSILDGHDSGRAVSAPARGCNDRASFAGVGLLRALDHPDVDDP